MTRAPAAAGDIPAPRAAPATVIPPGDVSSASAAALAAATAVGAASPTVDVLDPAVLDPAVLDPAIPGPARPGAADADADADAARPRVLGPDPAGFDVREYLDGLGAFLAGVANVVMQLSWAPVGHGVVESRVAGGRLTHHPVKRFRTTLTYVAVSMLGSDEERARYRDAVNAAHRQVRSTSASSVRYNALWPELQLWVAACMYQGAVDVHTRLHGPIEPPAADAFYRHAARFGTTLQVRQPMWPTDRVAFDLYWEEALGRVAMDPTVRAYLHGLVTGRGMRWPFSLGPRRLVVFVTTGFLPPRFREEMGLAWSAADQARFDRTLRRLGAVQRRLPRFARLFPYNVLLLDMRLRRRLGQRLV
ncbi:oxygenase MpaB family protein [Pseudofrankia sp. BMG5.37]|uniref:oxygenase MpaB family protein n=1 Tax=Pseudofrankia sp. BMG5.36 TaxID=1834512 RepID=UPI000B063233|nr:MULTISPECIES: oxygenase MpaB family protein [unclassified Pseudofrankia]MDT3445033.1 oxygenase MpaB family protein [Pseudofrankia sp. BMG5.37]